MLESDHVIKKQKLKNHAVPETIPPSKQTQCSIRVKTDLIQNSQYGSLCSGSFLSKNESKI